MLPEADTFQLFTWCWDEPSAPLNIFPAALFPQPPWRPKCWKLKQISTQMSGSGLYCNGLSNRLAGFDTQFLLQKITYPWLVNHNDGRPRNVQRWESPKLQWRRRVNLMEEVVSHQCIETVKTRLVGWTFDNMSLRVEHCTVNKPRRCCRKHQLEYDSAKVDPSSTPHEWKHLFAPFLANQQVQQVHCRQWEVYEVRNGSKEVENWCCKLCQESVWVEVEQHIFQFRENCEANFTFVF